MRDTQSNTASAQWVTARKYAAIFDLHPQTLANWRYKDRVAGRNGASEGFPVYRRFGTAVRYLLADEQPEAAA